MINEASRLSALLDAHADAMRNRVLQLAVGSIIFFVIALSLISTLVMRRIVASLGRLEGMTSAVAAGDLTASVPIYGSDEVGRLSRAFNEMARKLKVSYTTLETEIDERKQAEEALRHSEERFRTMANAIPQLAWIAKSDGYIFWYNQRWYDYTGATPEQMEGWGWQSVHDPEELPQVLERWKASIATGLPFDMVFPLRGADGQFRPFLTPHNALEGCLW
jgi:PAS domain S-box-containing protein